VIERAVDLASSGRKIALAPYRREAGGRHQGILLAQRHIEHGAESQDISRLGSARPDSRKLTWRCEILADAGQRELREARALAPPFQPRPNAVTLEVIERGPVRGR
jgi:hypothetical protein